MTTKLANRIVDSRAAS